MAKQAEDFTFDDADESDTNTGTDNVRPLRRPKALLSVDEAAEMLGQSRSSLYRAIHLGEAPFPVYKIGTFRIPTVAIQRLLNGEAPPRQES